MARNEESWRLMVARRIDWGESSLERIDDIAAEERPDGIGIERAKELILRSYKRIQNGRRGGFKTKVKRELRKKYPLTFIDW